MQPLLSGTPGPCDILAIAAARKLRDLVSGPLGALIAGSFKVMPQQDRAMESVERMLAAVERLARRARSLDRLTMDAVAAEAHVTPQAAYRYFRDVEGIIRLFARRVQTVEHELLMAALVERRFDSEAELAETAVSFVAEAYRQVFDAPVRIRARIARDHAEISYGLVATLSRIVCPALKGRGGPCARIGAAPLNAALVAIMAVAVASCLSDDPLLPGGAAQATMRDVFLAAIGRRG